MPAMDGYEFVRRRGLQARIHWQGTAEIPFIGAYRGVLRCDEMQGTVVSGALAFSQVPALLTSSKQTVAR